MNLLVQDIWNQVLEGFARLHGGAMKELWLKHSRPLSFTKGLFVLGVPNLFIREWLERKYIKDIESLFMEVTGCPVKIMVRIDGYLYRLMKEMQSTGSGASGPGEEVGDGRDSPAPLRGAYVVRPENRLIYSAFEKMLREPPGAFNPLYFYGPNGVGKTHLVHHFLSRAKQLKRFPTWYMVDAGTFVKEFSQAARIGDRVRFRGAILRCDLLIIEDIHELEGKLKVQLELVSILKYLTERSRQAVITSSCHPRDIRLIENSLASFMLSGMVVSISGYSLNSTVEILSARCAQRGINVPPTLIETIAHSSSGGLMGLMKLIEDVVALAAEKGEVPTPGFLKEHFPEYGSLSMGEDSVDRIIELVSKRLSVPRNAIASNSKMRKVVMARHLVIYLASTLLHTSSRRICRWLGNISPSIVPYARKKVDTRRRTDQEFNTLVLELQSEVEGGQKYLF